MSSAQSTPVVLGEAGLRGEIYPPSDKSITHRLILFSSVAQGGTAISSGPLGRDNLASLRIMEQLGVQISCSCSEQTYRLARDEGICGVSAGKSDQCQIEIKGGGFESIQPCAKLLFCGNSGTTARLLTGLLAGIPTTYTVDGDQSLRRRPFRRIIEPLRKMGAVFSSETLPFSVSGRKLGGINFRSEKSSAQVKSALLLAGLRTDEEVTIIEPYRSRNHTERLFSAMGCEVSTQIEPDGTCHTTLPKGSLRALRGLGQVRVPGDFSAASFFIVASLVIPNSDLIIRNVGFNPTRIGLFEILKRMNASIDVITRGVVCGEEVVDLRVRASNLRGTKVDEQEVALAIDEIPVLAVAASFAEGRTMVEGAGELRVKESDRLQAIGELLATNGFFVEANNSSLVIEGKPGGRSNSVNSPSKSLADWTREGDHRMIMCAAIMELALRGAFNIIDLTAVETSFPNFIECFHRVV